MAKRILVIDDEEDINMVVCSRLEASGFEVISAFDGLEGLEKARKENPDLIILDVMMPKLDGFHVCRMLKFDEKFQSTPIILLTARSQAVDKQTGEQVSADCYLTKPFDGDILLKEVKKLLKLK